MTLKNPSEYTPSYINTLNFYLCQAQAKVNGSHLYDVPSSHYLKNDDMDAIENLHVFLSSIVSTLSTTYDTPARKKAQTKLQESYMNLLKDVKAHEKYSKILLPKLENGLTVVKSSPMYLNNLIEVTDHATLKIQGVDSFDLLSKDGNKDNAWTPIEEFHLYFKDIVNVFNTSYEKSEQKEAQTKLQDAYKNLLETSKSHSNTQVLAERLANGLKPNINSGVNINSTNINDLV